MQPAPTRLKPLTRALLSLLTILVVAIGGIASPARAQFSLPKGNKPAGQEAAPARELFHDSRDRVAVSAVRSAPSVAQGGDLAITIVLDIDHGWHIWPQRANVLPGTATFKTAQYMKVALKAGPDGKPLPLPPGVRLDLGFAQYPEAHKVKADVGDGPQDYAVFEGIAPVFVPLTIDREAPVGTVSLAFEVSIQACDDSSCLAPATIELAVPIEIVAMGAAGANAAPSPDAMIFRTFDTKVFADIRSGMRAPSLVEFNVFQYNFSIDARGAGFFLLLLVAAVGGFLLNLTPCVLPVIPLKIMGLSAAAGTRGRTFFLGAMMSFGVIAFWMALGVAVSSIKGFTSANQLFQYPAFVIGVGTFVAIMAVGMMGLFSVGLPQWVYMINPKQESAPGAIGFGVMTAVLSTPCTAPLMGAAIAWATTQSQVTVLLVFMAVGVGMAIPYLVLAAFPQLTKSMPRSGPASELIKQVMGLLLLSAAMYFIGAGVSGLIVTPPDPPTKLYWWAVALPGFTAGLWLLVRTLQIAKSAGNRLVFCTLGLVIAAAAGLVGITQTAKGPVHWTYYTPERLAEAKKRGDTIVLDFTAEWCLNCKTLEAAVLNQPHVSTILNGTGVAPIKIDLTGNNTDGNALLKSLDRITIPLLVVMAPDGTVVFKSDTYASDQVLEAIDKARGQTAREGGQPPAAAEASAARE